MEHMQAIREALASSGLEALLLTDPISCRYATGFYFTDGSVLVTPSKAFLLTDSRYTEAAQARVKTAEVIRFSPERKQADILRELLAGVSGAVGAEEERLSHRQWLFWEETLGRPLVSASKILQNLRRSKDAGEQASMIAAQRIAEKALEEVLGLLRPGLTERQVAAELTYRMLLHGGEGNSFDPIVVTGANSSMPHGVPGETLIREGDFVTLDFGTLKDGYCSDMTRTVAIGYASGEMREVYDTVLRAQKAGIASARAGVPGSFVHAAAAKVIADAGYGPYFGHGFGHSLGLEIHELPSAAPSAQELLPEGAVISAEPGIYLPGRFGVRIEDVLILRADGAENITLASRELLVL